MHTWINDRDVGGIIGIEDVSTTKGDWDGEQEEIEQINTHTKVDILKENMLIKILMALSLSIYFDNDYWVCSDRNKAYPLKWENFMTPKILDDRKWSWLAHYISKISHLFK